jgi:hypothetical protein
MSDEPRTFDNADKADILPAHAAEPPPGDVQPDASAAADTSHTAAGVNAADAAGTPGPVIKIDPMLRCLLPPLSSAEFAALEKNIIRERKCLEPLTVWKETGILLDGHNRLEICKLRRLPYTIREIELPNQAAAVQWIRDNQDGRRNSTPEGDSHFRGMMYNALKHGHGGDRSRKGSTGQSDRSGTTDQALAKHFNVSPKTIRRDAKFALAVEVVAANCGSVVRQLCLARDARLTRPEVERLAMETPARQCKAIEQLLNGRKLRTAPAKRTTPRPRIPTDPDVLARVILELLDEHKLAALLTALERARPEQKPAKKTKAPEPRQPGTRTPKDLYEVKLENATKRTRSGERAG